MHHILFPHWRTKKDVIWLRFPVDTHKMKFKLMITFRLFVFFSTMFFPYLTKISLTRRPKHRFLNQNNGEMKAFSCWEDATHKICNAYWFEKANNPKKSAELIRQIHTAQWKKVHTGYRTTSRYIYYGMMTVIQQNRTAYSKKASKHIWFLIKFYSFSTEDMIKFVTIARSPVVFTPKTKVKCTISKTPNWT